MQVTGQRTTGDVIQSIGSAAESRLRPAFQAASVAYPPQSIALIGLKDEKRLELWARPDAHEPWRHVRDYAVLGASGGPGPKLREGDLQVPEGVYAVTALNPNSSFYLSMRLDYPNAFDRARAAADRRTSVGGDIFIHGKSASVGCLAIGDDAIEELFVLVVRVGISNMEVILAPHDLRSRPTAETEGLPPWTDELYAEIRNALIPFTVQAAAVRSP